MEWVGDLSKWVGSRPPSLHVKIVLKSGHVWWIFRFDFCTFLYFRTPAVGDRQHCPRPPPIRRRSATVLTIVKPVNDRSSVVEGRPGM